MTALITTILIFTIKVLKVVLVIGLVAGSVVAAKKYLFGDEKIDFSFLAREKPAASECSCCKVTLEAGYKFCPKCGTAKETVAEEKTVVETA